ncbi:MAG: hypothetical protein WBE11_10405 [Candidatus Aminicenantaceae bacterium]
MKKIIIFLGSILLIFGVFLNAGEISFDDFRNLIKKDILPAGFTLNESRTSGSRFSYRVEYEGDKAKGEMISFSLYPGIEEFSEMDKAGDPESYNFKGRSALFADGNIEGMAGFSMILKNKKGKLEIHHRVFGSKFLSKADLEEIVIKIGLENLEK